MPRYRPLGSYVLRPFKFLTRSITIALRNERIRAEVTVTLRSVVAILLVVASTTGNVFILKQFKIWINTSIPDVSYDRLILTLSVPARVGVTFAVGLIGYLFFRLKKKQQFFYGILETSFALASAYFFSGDMQSKLLEHNTDITLFFSGFATIYLIVRGLSNVDEGIRKDFAARRWFLGLSLRVLNKTRIALEKELDRRRRIGDQDPI